MKKALLTTRWQKDAWHLSPTLCIFFGWGGESNAKNLASISVYDFVILNYSVSIINYNFPVVRMISVMSLKMSMMRMEGYHQNNQLLILVQGCQLTRGQEQKGSQETFLHRCLTACLGLRCHQSVLFHLHVSATDWVPALSTTFCWTKPVTWGSTWDGHMSREHSSGTWKSISCRVEEEELQSGSQGPYSHF